MAEQSIEYILTTPAGEITFNPSGGGDGFYLTGPPVGLDGGDVRSEMDDVPQDDGTFYGPFFRSGIRATFPGVILAEGGTSARRALEDKLRGWTNGLLRPTAAQLVASCRMRWAPSGADERMLDAVQLLQKVEIDGGYLKTFSFTLASPYPYAMSYAQTSTVIASGASAVLTNLGDATVRPVLQITSAGAGDSVANSTTGQSLVFSSSPGGTYAEADCFRRTIYRDGNGADETGTIDWLSSDFLELASGANTIHATGCGVTVLWNHGYVG